MVEERGTIDFSETSFSLIDEQPNSLDLIFWTARDARAFR
jgi:hypothetical protein